jgi:hypothetical protein
MSIFGRLGYDSANTANVVENLSNTAIHTMNQMPPLLNKWQTEDLANNVVGGYFKNPVANSTQSVWNVANSIIAITGLSDALSNVASNVSALIASSNSFYLHTDRISGMSQPNASTATLPHYFSAMSVSKIMMYITFQSDGIQNNAPMMGNFTSLTIDDSLKAVNTIISIYPSMIANSINAVSVGTPPDEYVTYTSNLSSNQIQTIIHDIQSATNLMNSRRTGDVTFFNNSQAVVRDYNTVDQFSTPGQTETYLFNNYIGSDKLKSRINS